MRVVLKIVKWIVIVVLVLIALVIAFLFWLSKQPAVPTKYTSSVDTGGAIEAKYMELGTHEVETFEIDAPEDWGKFIIHYPSEMKSSSNTYPVVVFVNGTGVYGSCIWQQIKEKYPDKKIIVLIELCNDSSADLAVREHSSATEILTSCSSASSLRRTATGYCIKRAGNGYECAQSAEFLLAAKPGGRDRMCNSDVS